MVEALDLPVPGHLRSAVCPAGVRVRPWCDDYDRGEKRLKIIRQHPANFSLAVMMGCFLWTSFYGLNFGTHWDETRAKFDSVRDSLKTGLLLQGAALSSDGDEYNHGGLNYLLTWSGLTPELVRFLFAG